MRTYTFSVGGVRVEMRGSKEDVSLYTWCLVTAWQYLRRQDGQRPRSGDVITRATRLHLGMRMLEGRSLYVH